jgi:hypothetical protein
MRTVRMCAIAMLWLNLMAASAASASSTHRTANRCSPGRGHVIAADRQAELYKAPFTRELPEILGIFGCTFRAGRSYALGNAPEPHDGGPGGESGVVNATLAGTIVAYSRDTYYETGGGRDVVVVDDLQDGRLLHEVPTGTDIRPGEPSKPEPPQVGIGPVVHLVVRNDGAAGWIVATGRVNGTYQVHAIDKTGTRTLATGSDIAPGSLSLAGSTLHWTQGHKAMSAQLD